MNKWAFITSVPFLTIVPIMGLVGLLLTEGGWSLLPFSLVCFPLVLGLLSVKQ